MYGNVQAGPAAASDTVAEPVAAESAVGSVAAVSGVGPHLAMQHLESIGV